MSCPCVLTSVTNLGDFQNFSMIYQFTFVIYFSQLFKNVKNQPITRGQIYIHLRELKIRTSKLFRNISNLYKELVTLDQLSTQNLVFYTMPNKMADVKISCLVCGSSAGKHNYYGARTCISCRGFFRRSVQSQQYSMFLCASDSSCDLESKSRKCCKRCRFEKCIKIGMRPSWVLTPEERCQRMLQR